MGPFGTVDQSEIESLELLILEHERAIENYVQRLDKISHNEDSPNADLIQTQIEFVLLQVRSQLVEKQRQLAGMRAFQEQIKTAQPFVFPPVPGPRLADALFRPVNPADLREAAHRIRQGCKSDPVCEECERLSLLLESIATAEPAPADGQVASGGNKT